MHNTPQNVKAVIVRSKDTFQVIRSILDVFVIVADRGQHDADSFAVRLRSIYCHLIAGHSFAFSVLIRRSLMMATVLAHAIRNRAEREAVSPLLGLAGALALLWLIFFHGHGVGLL